MVQGFFLVPILDVTAFFYHLLTTDTLIYWELVRINQGLIFRSSRRCQLSKQVGVDLTHAITFHNWWGCSWQPSLLSRHFDVRPGPSYTRLHEKNKTDMPYGDKCTHHFTHFLQGRTPGPPRSSAATGCKFGRGRLMVHLHLHIDTQAALVRVGAACTVLLLVPT